MAIISTWPTSEDNAVLMGIDPIPMYYTRQSDGQLMRRFCNARHTEYRGFDETGALACAEALKDPDSNPVITCAVRRSAECGMYTVDVTEVEMTAWEEFPL